MGWTKERLEDTVRQQLGEAKLVVVANREPYIHVEQGGEIHCMRPASGVATALDPVMRACGGVWVAHGSGNADRLVTDDQDRVAVPPEDPPAGPVPRRPRSGDRPARRDGGRAFHPLG